ncbi:MAG: hypothetical protein LBC07_06695 [Elusimicrobiota bacterium]|nr:hypothetical protein [Elusimicrobiota bacterium]
MRIIKILSFIILIFFIFTGYGGAEIKIGDIKKSFQTDYFKSIKMEYGNNYLNVFWNLYKLSEKFDYNYTDSTIVRVVGGNIIKIKMAVDEAVFESNYNYDKCLSKMAKRFYLQDEQLKKGRYIVFERFVIRYKDAYDADQSLIHRQGFYLRLDKVKKKYVVVDQFSLNYYRRYNYSINNYFSVIDLDKGIQDRGSDGVIIKRLRKKLTLEELEELNKLFLVNAMIKMFEGEPL